MSFTTTQDTVVTVYAHVFGFDQDKLPIVCCLLAMNHEFADPVAMPDDPLKFVKNNKNLSLVFGFQSPSDPSHCRRTLSSIRKMLSLLQNNMIRNLTISNSGFEPEDDIPTIVINCFSEVHNEDEIRGCLPSSEISYDFSSDFGDLLCADICQHLLSDCRAAEM
ncbi:MAG: hypothetical protein GY813_04450 [Halieaceae bacterium]|nr:hypothetical protein [Halieaceae bacterium]